MATVTLDSIRKGVEAKYKSYVIGLGDEEVHLLNPFRLSEDRRKQLTDTIDSFSNEESSVDPVKAIEKIIDIVARSGAEAKNLKSAAGGELPVLMEILNGYMEEQKVGEASPSAN